jgi:hypothetical protein
MEVGKEKHSQCPHRAQLNKAVPESTRFICATRLVVLGVVREDSESLPKDFNSLSGRQARTSTDLHMSTETDVIHWDVSREQVRPQYVPCTVTSKR